MIAEAEKTLIWRECQPGEIWDLVRQYFETDPDVVNKFGHPHMIGKPIDECVNDFMEYFNDWKATDRLYIIENDKKAIGIMGTKDMDECDYMNPFFLLPEFRTPENKKLFISLIDKIHNRDYFTGIFPNNTRAKSFLEKNGFILMDSKSNHLILKKRR